MKKIFIAILLILLLFFVCYLYATYHTPDYIHENLVLSNNIRTLWIMTQDDIALLSQIDVNIVIWNGLTWWRSIDRWVWLWDNMWWYMFIHEDNTQQFFLRSKIQTTWKIENELIYGVKPTKITDILLEQSWTQIIVQWTWWHRIEQIKKWP